MKYFDMAETVQKDIAAVRAAGRAVLDAPVGEDPERAPRAVAELLTFLPEEERIAAVKNFVLAMLLD